MSRSNNTEIVNPATKYLRWDGTKGGFQYWDKEQEENIKVSFPFTFLVLDILSTVSGYSDADQSGFWANEVRKISEEEVTVRTAKGKQASGIWSEIKGSDNLNGAKFCQSVYIAMYNENKELVIANIQLTGAALSAWFDFKKKAKVYEKAVSVSEFTNEKKGNTEYTVPVFTSKDVSEETNQKAIELDQELQDYLKTYLKLDQKEDDNDSPDTVSIEPNSGEVVESSKPNTNDSPETFVPEGDDDLPF